MKLAPALLVLCGVGGLFWYFLFFDFRGLSHAKGMEQAQIAREIARGNGFSTKMIRPLSLWYFAHNERDLPTDPMPETYHAPLNCLVNAALFRATHVPLIMMIQDSVFGADQVIAALSAVFFLGAVGISHMVARRLFDEWVALVGCGLLLVSQQFWRFCGSGLPQMLMLLIFSGCAYTQVRALEARQGHRHPTLWIAASGALFGLLALAHALTIWIFLGALIFACFVFRPFWRNGLVMLTGFAVVYFPWLFRNYLVSNDVCGLSAYSLFCQIEGSNSEIMRALQFSLHDFTPLVFRTKIQNQLILQFGQLYKLLGQNVLAPAFFLALMQIIDETKTALYRWCVLLMWSMAALGMAVFGLEEKGLMANDLHVLFIPLMVFYGLGFVREHWSNLRIRSRFAQLAFVPSLYCLSALPLISSILDREKARFHWPPYVPPCIAVFREWTGANEIIASDIPWAVAWYADRKSLWLPATQKDFITLNDYEKLGGKTVGIYLTPVTGDLPLMDGLLKAEYKDWAGFVMRRPVTQLFPLRHACVLPVDGGCVYYGDRLHSTKETDAAIARIRLVK